MQGRCKDDTPFSVLSLRACCGWAWRSWLIIDLKITICILFAHCCSWFCLRTVSKEWLILRLFILTPPGEEVVTGHWRVFSAPLCEGSPLLCAFPVTLALCQCQGNNEAHTVVLHHLPALNGLLPTFHSQRPVAELLAAHGDGARGAWSSLWPS